VNVQDITGGSTWAIAAAAFSNPMYLSGPLGKSDNSTSTGFQITPGAALVVGFEGTYTGSTVAHEQTMDPDGVVGWFSVEGSPSTGAAATSTGSTSGVAYVFTCIGVLHRVKVTALSSGTIEVRIRLESEAISTSGGGGGGGGGGGLVEATATAAAPSYVEGSDNALSSDLHGSLRSTILDAAGAAVDWEAPVPIMGVDGATIATVANPFPVQVQTGSNVIGAVTQSGAFTVSGTGTAASPATGLLSIQGFVADDAALGVTATNPVPVGGKYNATLPTYADGDRTQLQFTTRGEVVVGGSVASLGTDFGNPVKVGAVYNSTQPTVANGQRVDLQTDASGNLRAEPPELARQYHVTTDHRARVFV